MSTTEKAWLGNPFAYDRPVSERLDPDQHPTSVFSLQHNRCAHYINDFHPANDLVSLPCGKQTRETVVMLRPGQQVLTHAVQIGSEHVIDLSLCVEGGDDTPLPTTLSLRHIDEQGVSREILSFHVHLKDPARRHEIQIALPHLSGMTARFSLQIRRTDKPTSSVGISRFLICPKLSVERINALTNYGLRTRNELANFSGDSYTHSMYGEAVAHGDGAHLVEKLSTRTKETANFATDQEAKLRAKLDLIHPNADEPIYNLALRCLSLVLPLEAPDFFSHIARASKEKPLRVLSLCSGAARIEEQMLTHAINSIDLTLFDVSEPLIKRAASRINQPRHHIRYLVGDINNGIPTNEIYDVIVCVSALHHVVELELLLAQINERLAPDGQFWNLGEQIGRNGNRLWPEGLRAANIAFSKLPEHLRVNAITRKPDTELPDDDFSTNCFEGIRSESLEAMLDRYLLPVHVYKRNCFLWRLTDSMYCDNYSLSSKEDLRHLKELVVAEAMHWLQGGRATEMHAVYKRREF